MDELRITKGLARWTSGFTPPASAHTADANDVLLVDGDESNAVFTDSTTTPHTITNNSGVAYNASGQLAGAMEFNGTSSYLSVPNSADWDFGSDDFTIDMWVKDNGATTDYPSLLGWRASNGNNDGWAFHGYRTLDRMPFFFGAGASNYQYAVGVASTGIWDGSWHHIAVVRDGETLMYFLDGVYIPHASDTPNVGTETLRTASPSLLVGRYTMDTSRFWKGSIDDLRISKGIARWTTNFTPPTAPYSAPILNIAPNDPTLNNFNNGSSGADNTPTLDFDLSDPDEGDEGDEIKYSIEIDNNNDFSSPEQTFTEAGYTTAPRAGETFTASPLTDGTYYWRVKAIDDEGLESSWSEATTGFVVDTGLPVSKILYPQNNGNLKNVNRIIGR